MHCWSRGYRERRYGIAQTRNLEISSRCTANAWFCSRMCRCHSGESAISILGKVICYDSSAETNTEGQSRVREVTGKQSTMENKVSRRGKQV